MKNGRDEVGEEISHQGQSPVHVQLPGRAGHSELSSTGQISEKGIKCPVHEKKRGGGVKKREKRDRALLLH